jgi:hypothetical protein
MMMKLQMRAPKGSGPPCKNVYCHKVKKENESEQRHPIVRFRYFSLTWGSRYEPSVAKHGDEKPKLLNLPQ